MRKLFLLGLIWSCVPTLLFGQYAMNLVPRVSPDRSTSIRLAYTELSVFYGAPSVNGRSVLGELIPYETIWRAGANEATRFQTSQTIFFGADSLAAGEYALFVVAEEEGPWTVIFSNKAKQWGAFRYYEADDALQIEVLPQSAAFQEQLLYSLHQQSESEGQIRLTWGNTMLAINFRIDPFAQFKDKVFREAAQRDSTTQWVVYVQGAEYLANQGQELDVALDWLKLSEQLATKANPWNEQFYPKHYILGHIYWTRAKVYAQMGEYAKAVSSANALLEIRSDYNFYDKKAESERIDELVAEWRERL